jgi:hypothetical protein
MILPMIFYLTKRLIAKANYLMKCIWGTLRAFQEQQPYFFHCVSSKSEKAFENASIPDSLLAQSGWLNYLGADTITKAGRKTRSEMV